MVSARFGGDAVPYGAKVVSPGLMVMAIILFMGAVGGAHLNPAVSVAFALERQLPLEAGPRLRPRTVPRCRPRHPPPVEPARQAGVGRPHPAWPRRLHVAGDVVGGGADGRSRQHHPRYGLWGPTARAPRRARCRRLHSARGAVGLAGERSVDEPGQVHRTSAGARRLDRLVGVSGRTVGRGPDSRRYRTAPEGSRRGQVGGCCRSGNSGRDVDPR